MPLWAFRYKFLYVHVFISPEYMPMSRTAMLYGYSMCNLGFLVAQRVKRLPAMRETWVRSLGQEDPLEKELAPHSSTLAWKIPWTEKPGGLQSMIAKSQT